MNEQLIKAYGAWSYWEEACYCISYKYTNWVPNGTTQGLSYHESIGNKLYHAEEQLYITWYTWCLVKELFAYAPNTSRLPTDST